MKVRISLENSPGCELDSTTIEIEDIDEALSDAVKRVLSGWILSAGDTVKIREIDFEGRQS